MSLFETLMAGLMAITALSMVLASMRIILGPSVPDRAMAFDLIMIHVVALIGLYAVVVDRQSLVDAILIVAVLGFLGTVALARYIEKGGS
ncbi:MAG: monovalent cation/H+ antiporter complex subunit F [Oscillochloridaceae bacterium umkhey_bin13]